MSPATPHRPRRVADRRGSAPPILVFDGACNLCAGIVRFVLRQERDRALRFAALQSAAGRRLMREHGLAADDPQTFLLIADGVAYGRTDAVIQIARRLHWPARALALLRFVPRPLRDAGYDLVARNRYRWFGRRDACAVPNARDAHRFLQGDEP
jgi:predicted DCC family thiol-disulfide oxidoreductase YuxK